MKRMGILLLVVILLTSCTIKPGTTENVEVNLGSSSKFSTEEIHAAADSVIRKFRDFEDCDLTHLWYDEEVSNREAKSYHATEADPDNAIVLLSNFNVGPSGGDGGFEANSTYSDWMWILKRTTADGEWVVMDWGY